MTMKKHIDLSQLFELREKQQNQLRDWWVPQIGDLYTHNEANHYYTIEERDGYIYYHALGLNVPDGMEYHKHIKSNCLPLLTICQMIELLNAENKRVSILSSGGEWEVFAQPEHAAIEAELCDALWKVVKQVL
ncbi:hypothetical protein D3C77_317370 [compost metagenome]